MKKLLLCGWTALLLALLCCACQNTASTDTDATTPTSSTAATTTTATTATTESTAAVTTTTAIYATSFTVRFEETVLDFELTLPASWEGAYAVREDSTSVAFYELQNHLYNGQGKLFTVRFLEEAVYDEGMFPDYTLIGMYEGYAVVALHPTDVQFASDLAAPYQAMIGDCDEIVASFRLL